MYPVTCFKGAFFLFFNFFLFVFIFIYLFILLIFFGGGGLTRLVSLDVWPNGYITNPALYEA
jgi:hypothetical protein